MANRSWNVDDKLAIVLRGLKYSQSIADLCREFQIRQSQYYKWRDQFLEHGRAGLASGKQKGADHHRQEVERLEQIIGKQTVIITELKKTL